MANSSENATKVFFRDPEDWKPWSASYIDRIQANHLDTYFHDGVTMPAKPRYPHPKDFKRTEDRLATPATGTTGTIGGSEPPPPAESTRARSAASRGRAGRTTAPPTTGRGHDPDHNDRRDEIRVSDLTQAEEKDYNDAVMRYRCEAADHNKTEKEVANMRAWIRESIAPKYITMIQGKNIFESYHILKAQAAPYNDKLKQGIRQGYFAHIHAVKKYEKKMTRWIELWKSYLDEAEAYDMKDIIDPAGWYAQLGLALHAIQGSRIDTWALGGEFTSLEQRIRDGEMTYTEVAAIMEARISNDPKAKAPLVNAGFLALGGVEADQEEDTDTKPSKRRDGSQQGGPAKRKRANTEAARCELCDKKGHSLERCFYVYPDDHEDLPTWFDRQLDETTSRFVERILKYDDDLAAKVKKITEKLKMD